MSLCPSAAALLESLRTARTPAERAALEGRILELLASAETAGAIAFDLLDGGAPAVALLGRGLPGCADVPAGAAVIAALGRAGRPGLAALLAAVEHHPIPILRAEAAMTLALHDNLAADGATLTTLGRSAEQAEGPVGRAARRALAILGRMAWTSFRGDASRRDALARRTEQSGDPSSGRAEECPFADDPSWLGIPWQLAELANWLCRALGERAGRIWAAELCRSLPAGIDLYPVYWRYLRWLLVDGDAGAIRSARSTAGRTAVERVAQLADSCADGRRVARGAWLDAADQAATALAEVESTPDATRTSGGGRAAEAAAVGCARLAALEAVLAAPPLQPTSGDLAALGAVLTSPANPGSGMRSCEGQAAALLAMLAAADGER